MAKFTVSRDSNYPIGGFTECVRVKDLNCGHERFHGWRRRATDESGQAMILVAVMIGMLLVVVGLVVDVGHAMLVQRQLQAGVDAAALAGAQHLPIQTEVVQVAHEYSPTPGRKNAVNTVSNAVTTVQVLCITGVPGCSRRDGGVNGLVVEASSDVPTWFGKIVGITKMSVSAKATACSPCTVKPLDIMVVLDRTGSMCQFAPGQWDPNCTDLNNARNGLRTFFGLLDPSLDKVGLALTPPVLNASLVSRCPPGGYKPWSGTSNPNPPPSSLDGQYFAYDAYWPYYIPDPRGQTPSRYVVASLEGADGFTPDDYLIQDVNGNWVLNDAQSAVLQRLGCTSGAGSTSYSLSVEEAQHELDVNGRGNVQDIIIFLSDGAANTSPMNLPAGHWTNNPSNQQTPCGTGVESAQRVKSAGTIVYTIGYDLDGLGGAPERCLRAAANGHQGSTPEACGTWGCTAYDAIRAMASSPSHFYNKPNPGELSTIFRAIALDLSGSRGRLIDNTAPSLIP